MVKVVKAYLRENPGEEGRLEKVVGFVRDVREQGELFSRKNFTGHITGSGFVLSVDRKRVLMLEHKTLGRMLQPGGHVEEGDGGPLEGAMREVREETGLVGLRYVAAYGELEVPLDIDTHAIPENKKKGEAGHWHHDFRYLFVMEEEAEVEVEAGESGRYQWVELGAFKKMEGFEVVGEKIERIVGGS